MCMYSLCYYVVSLIFVKAQYMCTYSLCYYIVSLIFVKAQYMCTYSLCYYIVSLIFVKAQYMCSLNFFSKIQKSAYYHVNLTTFIKAFQQLKITSTSFY